MTFDEVNSTINRFVLQSQKHLNHDTKDPSFKGLRKWGDWYKDIESLIESIPTKPPGRAIDIGSGVGSGAAILKSKGWDTYAIDIDPTISGLNKVARHHKFSLSVQDITLIGFKEESFDVSFGHHVLEHSICPIVALVEINRITKMGGYAAIGVPAIDINACSNHLSQFPVSHLLHLIAISGFMITIDGISISRTSGVRVVAQKTRLPLSNGIDIRNLSDMLPEQLLFDDAHGRTYIKQPNIKSL